MTVFGTKDDGPDQRGPAIVVGGSVTTGFMFIGPFDTVDDAVAWYKTTTAHRIGANVVVSVLAEPTNRTDQVSRTD